LAKIKKEESDMEHKLMQLPYSMDALEPHMSQETLEYHYLKHHQGYVNKLNELIAGTDYEDMGLAEIVKNSQGAVFNNSAQVFNHDFFWNSLTPNYHEPSSALIERLSKEFGSFEEFKREFTSKALSHFGSGWAWLVQREDGSLEIISTPNAATPITNGLRPLLVCDVWEHAYYIDHRNLRANYLENFFKLVNWEHVEKNIL